MLNFKKRYEVDFSNFDAIATYIATILALSSLIFPFILDKTYKNGYTFFDIINLGNTTVNVFFYAIYGITALLSIIYLFTKPNWVFYFIDLVLILALFFLPIFAFYELNHVFALNNLSLIMFIGGILTCISSIVFASVEISRLNSMR